MGDGKSERCLTLVELELDTCWDQHPCSSAILDVGRCTKGSVFCDPTTCDDDAGIIGICSSASTDILALLGKKPP